MSVHKTQKVNWFQRFTNSVVTNTEHFFFVLGCKVGTHPKWTILICWLIVALSSLGFLRFRIEKNPMKLWVPPETDFVRDTEWLMEKFQMGFRVQVGLLEAPDVLTPEVFQYLLQMDDAVVNVQTENGVKWNDVCFKTPAVDKSLLSMYEQTMEEDQKDISAAWSAALYCSFVDTMLQRTQCYERSILDLWDFSHERISNLTKDEIISTLNNYNRNNALNSLKNYEGLLGGVKRNESGHIIAAETLQNFWMVNVNFTAVDMDKVGNIAGTADWASEDGLEWEDGFRKIMENFSQIQESNITLYYSSARSFGDLSSSTMFQDMGILCTGIVIMVLYVQFVISKFNWLEARVTLACVGLLTVGMSFMVGCGLCSLVGISYGPVHTSLPFLLMGLGVDDMFVLMACWDDLSREQRKLPMPDQLGLMLKHGGVSITVTSVTDVLAFMVGAYTILPSLESFCIYAAVCVLMTFVYAVTFFAACFVLDQRRIESNRNGAIICIKHQDYVPNKCSQRQLSNKAFELIYSKFILTTPGKILVVLIAVICLGFSAESTTKLKQKFDPEWFVPTNSYFSEYLRMRKTYYPAQGFEGALYVGAVNYTHEFINIKRMVDDLKNRTDLVKNVGSWVDPFRNYVRTNFHYDLYEEVLSENAFDTYLSKFLFSPMYAKYQANFHFARSLECGAPVPRILLSNVDFVFQRFSGPEEYLPAMHVVTDIAKNNHFTTGEKFSTVWSKAFASWVTDEVIDTEVLRNLQLALLCVMACTILLIADIQTCFWIFICVLLTIINVCGFMQRWGLSINSVSCIGLELAIGLCVDYASHIGHTFLTIKQGTRTERSLKTVTGIGSAVVYGGLSTLIGVCMLSQSEAYIFQSFFKIFFLVVLFGLFHGVVFLPVIFSWIGPKPYMTGDVIHQVDIELNTSEK